MTQEVGVEQVFEAVEDAFKRNDLKRVEGLVMPALDQFPDQSRFWFYTGCLWFKRGYAAQAAASFERAIDLEDAPHIYSNLGACYRRMNRNAEGLAVLKLALDRTPDYAPALVNVGSMYVNEGDPHAGIPYLERAVELGGEQGAVWNLGLLYLEAARFGEGFDCYRAGVTHERSQRNYGAAEHGLPEPQLLDDAAFERAKQAAVKPRLIVWGEQGIGDELMFATILPDAREHFEVVFECHPRLERLHRNAYPGVPLYPTRKDEWITWPVTDRVTADYKAPLGDLACYYRRDLAAFTDAWGRHGAPYRANPAEVAQYRDRLVARAQGRPIVGLATRGGVMTTARTYRTLRIGEEIDRLMAETDALFVALDYDDMTPLAHYVDEKFGADRYLWYPSLVQHYDYDHTAALIGACDLVVTVCQSAFHLAAAMGRPTRCLVPKKCAWRYAPVPGAPDLSYWYPSPDVRLYRQDDPESWSTPLARAIADVNALPRTA